MEQPQQRNQFRFGESLNQQLGGPAGRGELPKTAGHILLESPHAGEVLLDRGSEAEQQKDAPARVEHSAWHSIPLDQLGQVVTQEYGKAFNDELKPEQMMNATSGQTSAAASAIPTTLTPVAQPTSDTPYAEAVVPVPQMTSQLSSGNPIYSTIKQSTSIVRPLERDDEAAELAQTPDLAPTQASVSPFAVPVSPATNEPLTPENPFMPPQAGSLSQAAPAEQYISQAPMGAQAQFAQAMPPQPIQPTMYGAVNPSMAMPALPEAPQMQDPRLAAGSPAPVDPQHLLPAPTNRLAAILKSPWFWLALGILMILYFARSL